MGSLWVSEVLVLGLSSVEVTYLLIYLSIIMRRADACMVLFCSCPLLPLCYVRTSVLFCSVLF